jgi:ABC-type uncharacterized transport system ATPase subunit
MDEPTSALSTSECETLFKVVRQLASGDAAMIYISHWLDVILDLADRVTVLRDGRQVRFAIAQSRRRARRGSARAWRGQTAFASPNRQSARGASTQLTWIKARVAEDNLNSMNFCSTTCTKVYRSVGSSACESAERGRRRDGVEDREWLERGRWRKAAGERQR